MILHRLNLGQPGQGGWSFIRSLVDITLSYKTTVMDRVIHFFNREVHSLLTRVNRSWILTLVDQLMRPRLVGLVLLPLLRPGICYRDWGAKRASSLAT